MAKIEEDLPALAPDVDEPAAEAGVRTATKASAAPTDKAKFNPLDAFKGWGEIRRSDYGMTPLIILALVSSSQAFGAAMFSVALPDVARDLDINIIEVLELIQLFGVLGVGGTILLGFYADRHRRVPMVTIGTIIDGVGTLFSAGAQSFGALLGAKGIAGQGNQAGDVPVLSLMGDYYRPDVRARVFVAYGTIIKVTALFAPAVGGILLTNLGWRQTTRILAVPVIIVGIVALIKLREPIRGYQERRDMAVDDADARVEETPKSLGETWRTIWAIRTLRRLFISNVLSDGPFLLFGAVSQLLFVEHYHLDAGARSLLAYPTIFATLLGGILGAQAIGFFMGRNPGRVLVIIGGFSVVSALGMLLFAAQPPLWILIAAITITGFGSSLIGPSTTIVFINVIPPHMRNSGIQMLGLAKIPGYFLVFPVFQEIVARYSFRGYFLAIIPFMLLGGAVTASAGGFFAFDMRNAYAAAVADWEWKKAKVAGAAKMLVCRKVDVSYDDVQVLFGVDFDVEEGEIIALLGTNGAGKSTLLRAISGTQEASSGAIVFDGRNVTHMPPHEIAGRRVIHMPGGRGTFPGLTVKENLLLANWMTEEDEIEGALREVYEIFPVLASRLDADASSLSGGEQQMLSLAQAFLAKPRLLMIDELSLGLSPAVVGQLLDIVREIHRRGTTIIIVEQSVNVALTIAQKAVFMEKGEVKFVGLTADLLRRPDVLRAVYVKGSGGGGMTAGAPGAVRSERDRRALELGTARPVLEIENVVKRYGGITALDGVSFTVREGEVLGLIGPNGSGKTTMFDVISGFQAPDEGVIRFDGVDITGLTPDELARRKLIRRFQDARLLPSLTVLETVQVALEAKHEAKSLLSNAVQLRGARRAEKVTRQRAERLVDLLELGAFRDKFVKELSTGVRRIVDLACALASEPSILMLDEPSSGIAQAEAEGLGPLLKRVQFETGCTMLIVEHDMPLITAVADELLALDQGQIVTRGRPDVVLDDERVIESYLGSSEAARKRSGSIE